MPYTLNGIGTRYYGRKNTSVVRGDCEFCKRPAQLSSFDTRECFCILYIPFIPLGKYRIQSQCSSCRRHYRIPFAAFQSQVDGMLGPLRAAVQRAPRDLKARLELIDTLIGMRMTTEAEREAIDAATALPAESVLHLRAGYLLAARGSSAAATEWYRKAVAADPKSADARRSYGSQLFDRGQLEEAARELEESRRIDGSNLRTTFLLAEAYYGLKRWPQALQTYEQLASSDPSLTSDKGILRELRDCKMALGYPLSDAERKAGRNWWPFGKSKPGHLKPAKNPGDTNWKRIGLGLAILVTVLVGGGFAYASWLQKHVDIYFDNGVNKTLTASIDGVSFALPSGSPVSASTGPGQHVIRILDAKSGTEVENYKATIPSESMWDALFAHRFFVYNVAGAHIYRRQVIGYAPQESDRTYEEHVIAFDRFIPQTSVDYVFTTPPESIDMSSSASREEKVAFNVADDLDYNKLGNQSFQDGKWNDAEKAFRFAVLLDPCGIGQRNLVQMLSLKDADAAASQARTWIVSCPSSVNAHRSYQDAMVAGGKQKAVFAEYAARVVSQPQDAASHYLYGRLLEETGQSGAQYREALRLDPKFSWAHFALGYNELELEHDLAAAEEMAAALRLLSHDRSMIGPYAMAAAAAGRTDEARALVTSLQHEGYDPLVWSAKWTLALGGRDFDGAKRMVDQLARAHLESEDGIYALRLQLAGCRGDEAEIDQLLVDGEKRKSLHGIVNRFEFERDLQGRRYAAAVALADTELASEEGGTPFLYEIYTAAAQMMAGDAAAANARLHKLSAKLTEPDSATQAPFAAMIRGLKGQIPADTMLASVRKGNLSLTQHAYFLLGARALAARDETHARQLFRKSESRSLDFSFPYLAAREEGKEKGRS
ncbi:MAG TPA: tetratricopeptide repeat protein [Thermoanaerobaculia bacterium]|nr:tetratricopeptide repeat protein [Thermoanaerobaculia bacterium]